MSVVCGETYAGARILDAMRSAPRYSDAIYELVRGAFRSSDHPILEFGAGDGAFVERFLRDGTQVGCVEPDLTSQAALKRLVPKVVVDIADCEADRYGFAYTINVLEHLSNLDRYMSDLYRVLRPGGRLFVFVPAFALLWTSLDDEVGHIQRFTRRCLTEHLERAGLYIEEIYYFDSLGFFAALVVRSLQSLGMFKYSAGTIGFYDQIFPISRMGDLLFSGILGKNLIAIASKA